MTEDHSVDTLPQVEGDFISRFPMVKYDQGTQWTERGSSEGLREKVLDAVESCLQDNPPKGIIEFEQLPDGGYQINYARLREDNSSNNE